MPKSRPKGKPQQKAVKSSRDEGLSRIAKAIERIAICVERREERRDLADAVSRMSLKQAAEEVGIKVSTNGRSHPASTRVLIRPNVVQRAHAKAAAQERHDDEG